MPFSGNGIHTEMKEIDDMLEEPQGFFSTFLTLLNSLFYTLDEVLSLENSHLHSSE